MQDWEKKFDEVALSKGYKLYCEGKVKNIKQDDAGISAFLPGIHNYDVAVKMRGNLPVRMKCQCPKSKGGSNCEHMAAVLYAVYGDGGAHEKAKAAEKEQREEAARRIEARNAEKAAKRAERKRKRSEAEEAARLAAQEAEQKRAEEEKRREEEALEKARKEQARREAEEAARKKQEEERARRREEKVQAAIERKMKKEAEEQNKDMELDRDSSIGSDIAVNKTSFYKDGGENVMREGTEADWDDYNYFDIASIRTSMQFSPENLREGKKLYTEGKVRIVQFLTGYTNNNEDMVAEVQAVGHAGKSEFPMRLLICRERASHVECRCPKCRQSYYWYAPRECCVYMAGLLHQIEEYLKHNRVGDATDRLGMDVLYEFQQKHAFQVVAESLEQEESQEVVPRLSCLQGKLSLSFRVGSGKLYVIKDLFEFSEQVQNAETAVYGSNTKMNHKMSNFTKKAQEWVRYIHKTVLEEKQMESRLAQSGWYSSRKVKHNSFELYGWKLDEFYRLADKEAIEYEDKAAGKKDKRMLHCKEAVPKVSMEIRKTGIGRGKEFHGVEVSCDMPVFFKGSDDSYFVEGDWLCRAKAEHMERIRLLADKASYGRMVFRVGRNNLSEFYYRFLPELRDAVDIIEYEPEEIHAYLPPEVQFLFYLDAPEHNITCSLHARYGEHEVSVLDIMDRGAAKPLERFRMKSREAEILHITRGMFPVIDAEKDELHCGHDEELMYSVLEHGVEVLLEYGEVKCTQRFRNMNVVRKVKLNIGVSVSSGLLDLDIETDDITREELLDVLKNYRLRKKFYRLKNGDFLNLEDDTLAMLGELMSSMRMSPKEFVKGNLHLPVYRTLYLDKLLEENESIYSTRDSHFREIVKSFKTVNEADYEVPLSLSGIMRGYQKKGYRWLRTLESCQFGGILADDMGLGKTLQAIAVLLAAKREGKEGTSLVVSPASLVFNWGEEFQKFAPELKVLLVSGSQNERQQKLEEYSGYDVLVTSYDLLKRDIALYEDKQFLYEIIDEAQYIKNHTTAASKAVKIVKSQIRFAMTGTPIENRLSELWSIFDYLMPGFLYSYDVFKKEIETPVVKNGDEEAMKRLQRMVGAFILRRLKSDVLKDLPDKLEEYRYVKMDKEQQKIYDAQVVHMQARIAQQNQEEFNKNKMQILAELMKLRQICCDPSLCFENYGGESAKLESCLELIQSAIDGGHKILLFSQFTTMLEILKDRLDALGVSYYVITGETAKEKRLQMVKAFNEDSTPLFLISLKAGGVGLNLTGADVVIHYDPWWNLAVQNQATDRAHRIGQTKKVTVYKLIVKQTIEEKIQKLQETKMDLADQIVNAQGGQIGSMSQEELLELLGA